MASAVVATLGLSACGSSHRSTTVQPDANPPHALTAAQAAAQARLAAERAQIKDHSLNR
jgi:hypothetical protein